MSRKKFYFSKNEDNILCAFDNETHICIDVLESTGDVPLTEEKRKCYLGRIDPKYSNA